MNPPETTSSDNGYDDWHTKLQIKAAARDNATWSSYHPDNIRQRIAKMQAQLTEALSS